MTEETYNRASVLLSEIDTCVEILSALDKEDAHTLTVEIKSSYLTVIATAEKFPSTLKFINDYKAEVKQNLQKFQEELAAL